MSSCPFLSPAFRCGFSPCQTSAARCTRSTTLSWPGSCSMSLTRCQSHKTFFFFVTDAPGPVLWNFLRSQITPLRCHKKFNCTSREPLLNVKAQYSWPPYSKYFRLSHFYTENIIYFCYWKSQPNEEVNCTGPSPSVSVHGYKALTNMLVSAHDDIWSLVYHASKAWA